MGRGITVKDLSLEEMGELIDIANNEIDAIRVHRDHEPEEVARVNVLVSTVTKLYLACKTLRELEEMEW